MNGKPMKSLNDNEIKLTLKKIRSKYDELVRFYKKSRVLSDAFEERYMSALRKKNDISVFLLAEIEAVEVLLKKEDLKSKEEKIVKVEKQETKETFADKVFDENRKKIQKYPGVDLGSESDEEASKLLGAMRQLLNDYFPALNYIYKERRHTTEGEYVTGIYHKLVTQYDYKNEVPIAKHYCSALTRQPRDFKKIDYEHRFLMQETAFLLNDIYEALDMIVKKNNIPLPENKIIIIKNDKQNIDNNFNVLFNNLSYAESMMKVIAYIQGILTDFRLKGIKKNYRL